MRAAEIYRKTRKKPDLLWNLYVCRPVAALLLQALQSTRITPNQITLASVFVAAVAAAILLTVPGYAGLLFGVIVFELSYVLDCADGMLARLRNTQSSAGHLLDFLMDELKAFAIFAAVAVRLYLQYQDVRFLLLGIWGLLCLASGIAMTTFLRRPEIAVTSAQSAPAPDTAAGVQPLRKSSLRTGLQLVEQLLKFLIHYPSYILFAALANRIEFYFFPYLAVNTLYAAATFAKLSLRFSRR